ncbi:MAG: glycosyltransferase family 4 protein [Dehalococcoidia bacterium]|nr:glycosyltransferase family 4 protein [Dehalococcoidia bacterium]
MRIAEVNDIASVATEIAVGLRTLGHEVDFFAPRLFGARLPAFVKPVTAPARALDWLDLIRRVRAGHYDLAHIHYAYLGNLGRLGRFPYILHCHGTDLRGESAFTRPLVRSAVRGARHVFYATPDLWPYLRDLRPDAEFLPNPIDLERFAPASPPSAGAGVFICCALTEIKGAGTVLEACAILAGRRPDIRFTAYAGGAYAPQFEALPNVTLIARQPRWKLPAIINQHAVVAGQMKLGTAGMAELEAMACARPVVTWFNEPDAYPEAPPFVSVSTADEMAREIERLVDDRAASDSAGASGRDWIARHHSLANVAARVESVARAIVDGVPVPPPH